jgi:hypothetical protein
MMSLSSSITCIISRRTIEARRNSSVNRKDFVSLLLELRESGSFRTKFHDPEDRFLQLEDIEDAEDFGNTFYKPKI